MDLDLFDYELPEDLIAQAPAERREGSRLLHLGRQSGAVQESSFERIAELLPEGAVLVLNEARVIPARIAARRQTGGKVEVFLIAPSLQGEGCWDALLKAGKQLRTGEQLAVGERAEALTIVEALGGGRFTVAPGPDLSTSLLEFAESEGEMPLPPYVKRPADAADRERYQTVYARVPGAIAAPTAGLHFSPALLERLEAERGIQLVRLVLHVGLGTFCPVRVEDVRQHRMEAERYEVSPEAVAALAAAQAAGRPIVACGTTSVRALEAYAQSGQPVGSTELFITPGYEFRLVQGLITNFHLPKSTLIMLVSAFAGRERVLAAYREAIRRRFRFYSYGDAMLVL